MTAAMRWRLLGSPRLEQEGAPAPANELPDTAPAYLGLFLATHGAWVARETVAAYLWPELPTERAQHNLRVALNRLQTLLQGLGVADVLQAERRRLRLAVASDLAEFRQAMAAGDWAQAAALPQGPLLQGTRFLPYPALAEWLEVEREALRRAWRQALAEAAAAASPIEAAAGRYLHHHPADAEVASLLATQLAAAGQPQRAQEVVDTFSRAAADELPPEDHALTVGQVERAVAAVGAASGLAAAERADRAPPLGREADVARLDAAAAAHRWVSVVGLPGVGKSTLVGAWLGQRGRDGAPALPLVRVALHGQSTAAGLAETLLGALGVKGQRARPTAVPTAALVAIADARALVVLDGLDPAAIEPDLAALLRTLAEACLGLRVVATARQSLGLPGERVLRIGGLGIEPAGASAQLFLREARRAAPQLRWAGREHEVDRIVQLCQGLPLALKLAAAWCRWIEPGEVATEITRSLGAGGVGEAFDSTLHGWIAAPVARLPAAQQQALAVLGLFPAAFGMRSAVAVAGVGAADIEALAAACLVEVEAGSPPQLVLHSLVRAFALAQLAASPARRREACARFLADVEARLEVTRSEHGQPVIGTAQVAACLADVHAAWPLALELGALATLPVLVQALHTWYEDTGAAAAGERLLAAALAALGEDVAAEAAVLARVQVARATLLYRAGDHDAAERAAQHAERLSQATGQRRLQRMAVNITGLSQWMAMRLDAAQAAFEQGLASAVADDERRGRAVFAANLALVATARGDYAAAERAHRDAIAADLAAGDWRGATTCKNNLGNLLRHLGRLDECEAVAQECLRLTHEHALDTQRPFALIGLALLRHAQGRLADAEQYLDLIRACDDACVEEPVRTGAAQLHACIALDRGDGAAALGFIAQALRVSASSDDRMNRAEALLLYARWLAECAGRGDDALRLWATLLHAPSTHATLRDQLRAQLRHRGLAEPEAPAAAADLSLAAEEAMAAAFKAQGSVAGPGAPARQPT